MWLFLGISIGSDDMGEWGWKWNYVFWQKWNHVLQIDLLFFSCSMVVESSSIWFRFFGHPHHGLPRGLGLSFHRRRLIEGKGRRFPFEWRLRRIGGYYARRQAAITESQG